jgi:hypothetical protein
MFSKPLTLGTYLVTIVVITAITMALNNASKRTV